MEIIESRKTMVEAEPETQLATLAEVDRVYDDPVPVFNTVLVKRGAEETHFNGTRFVIPDTARKSPNEGVVVAVSAYYIVDGQQFPTENLVKPGDLVTFSRFTDESVKVGDEEFLIVSVFDLKLVRRVTFAIAPR